MSFAEKYGPWAVIAGASEGTGAEFARQLAAEGIASVLVARREAPLAALAAEIKQNYGLDCVTVATDLSAADATDRIIAAVGNREIGLYVNNAGADPNGSRFLDRAVDDWIDLIGLNVTTMVKCTHHFAAQMRERGRGGILLVNSGACYGGGSMMAVYTASKAFMLNFAESLWADLKAKGVDVLTLVLGRTDTPAHRKLLAEKGITEHVGMASSEEVVRVGLARLPHGPIRNWGQEDDIAGYAPSSPEARAARVLMIDSVSSQTFGKDA